MKGASPKFGSRPLYNYNIDDEHSGVVATLQEEDDLKHICMNKKELQDFKDDKSLTVDYSFDDDHTMTNKQNLIFKEKNQMLNENKDDNIIMTTLHPQQLSPSNHKKTKTNVLWKFIGGDNSFDDNQELHRKHHTNDINNYISDENFFAFKERDYNPHHHLLSNRNDVVVSNDNISGIENISEVFPHKNIYSNNNNKLNNNNLPNALLNSDNIENLSEMYQQHRKDIEADLYQDDYGEDNFNEMSSGGGGVHDHDNDHDHVNVNNNINQKQTWPFGITHNELVIIGKPALMNSIASYGSVPSFGISRSQKIEKEYIELKKSYDDVLNLLQYWHGFYKDILEIVEAKKVLKIDELNDNDNIDSNEFMQNVIKTVKDLVHQAKNKVYRIFTMSLEHNFIIRGNQSNNYIKYNNNNSSSSKHLYQIVKKVNNLKIENSNKCFNKHKLTKTNQICLHIHNTIALKNDDENSFPPILLDSYKNAKKHPLTFITKHRNSIQHEFTYEYINISVNNSFPSHKTQFDKTITTCIENTIPSTSSFSSSTISSSYKQLPLTNTQMFFNKKRNSTSPSKPPFKSFDTSQYKVSSQLLFQFINKKKKTTHEIQTDLNAKHLDSIELMNKEYSTQLAITQKDKEKMQKLYEDKINLLTIKIEQQQHILNTQTSIDSTNTLKQSTSTLFLPELIPPEQTYKIFIHCIKHFKYEETLYKKFMEEADLQCMKAFVAKMEKLEQNQHNRGRTTKNYVSKYLKLKHNK